MDTEQKKERFFLVYQAGIANVFRVTSFNLADYGRDATRLFQGDWISAQNVCRGIGLMGGVVRSAHCNQAGDTTNAKWSEDLSEAPFNPIPLSINCNGL